MTTIKKTKAEFFLIGSQKSGTTTLSYQLSQHPEIAFCQNKEPDFFSKNKKWKTSIDEYHKLYNPSNNQICGEGSTTYSWLLEYPETASRIQEYNPNAKIIYLMRHPVDRVVSHYTHHFLKARTTLPKEQEVFNFPTYINHSRYAIQLRPYLELFPKKNILLLIFEEYVNAPASTLKKIALHLDIDPEGFNGIDLSAQYKSIDRTADTKLKKILSPVAQLIFPAKVRNALRGPFVYKLDKKIQFQESTKRQIWRYLEDDVTALETIMGRKLTIWRTGIYNAS